jgi:transcriptional antiterminator RfaH
MITAGAAELALERSTDVGSAGESLFSDGVVDHREGRNWWVFYTKARQEKALARDLSARRVPHYLPLHKKSSMCRGRRLSSYIPLFSGYVFLFVDLEERVTALASNRVSRTIDVPRGGQAQLFEDLTRIQRLIASGVPLTPESRIQPGEPVRIKSGRLAGLEGIVTKRRGESRLLVAVNYLQQGASIEIDDFALEAI